MKWGSEGEERVRSGSEVNFVLPEERGVEGLIQLVKVSGSLKTHYKLLEKRKKNSPKSGNV